VYVGEDVRLLGADAAVPHGRVGGDVDQALRDGHTQVLEELGAGVVGVVEVDLAEVGRVHVRDHHRGGALELGVVGHGRVDLVLDLGDDLFTLLGHAQSGGVHLDDLPPRGA